MRYGPDPAELLIYYLGLAGAPTDGDCAVEIREIVASIEENAVRTAREESRREMDALVGMIAERLGDKNFERVFRQDVRSEA